MSQEFEIIVAGQSERVNTESEMLLNTYYEDNCFQYILLESELTTAGFSAGATIDGLMLKVGEVPGMDITDIRIKIRHTSLNDLSGLYSFISDDWTLVYGPYTRPTTDFIVEEWCTFTFDTPFSYTSGNLLIELTRDLDDYARGGGLYGYEALTNRSLAVCDDGASYADYYDYWSGEAEEQNFIPSTKLIAELSSGGSAVYIKTLTACTDTHIAAGTVLYEEDFSDGIPANLVADKDGYTIVTEAPEPYTHSLQTRAIFHSEISTFSLYVYTEAVSKLSYQRYISSESGYDLFELYIDNILAISESGLRNWKNQSYILSAGMHELKWRYSKDHSASEGLDGARITGLKIESIAPGKAFQPITFKNFIFDDFQKPYTVRYLHDFRNPHNFSSMAEYNTASHYNNFVLEPISISDFRVLFTEALKVYYPTPMNQSMAYLHFTNVFTAAGTASFYFKFNCAPTNTSVQLQLDGANKSYLSSPRLPVDADEWYHLSCEVPAGLHVVSIRVNHVTSEEGMYTQADYIAGIEFTNIDTKLHMQKINAYTACVAEYKQEMFGVVAKARTGRITGYEVYTPGSYGVSIIKAVTTILEGFTEVVKTVTLLVTTTCVDKQFFSINETVIKGIVLCHVVFEPVYPLPYQLVPLNNAEPFTTDVLSIGTGTVFYMGNFITRADGKILACFRIERNYYLSVKDTEEEILTTANILETDSWLVYTDTSSSYHENGTQPDRCYLQKLQDGRILLYLVETVGDKEFKFFTYISENGLGTDFTYYSFIAQHSISSGMYQDQYSNCSYSSPLQFEDGRIAIVITTNSPNFWGPGGVAYYKYSDDIGHTWSSVVMHSGGNKDIRHISDIAGVLFTDVFINYTTDRGNAFLVSFDRGSSWAQWGRIEAEAGWYVHIPFMGNDGWVYYVNEDGFLNVSLYRHQQNVPIDWTGAKPYECGVGKTWEPLISMPRAFVGYNENQFSKGFVTENKYNIVLIKNASTDVIWGLKRNYSKQLKAIQAMYVITDAGGGVKQLSEVLEAYVITASGLQLIQYADIIYPMEI